MIETILLTAIAWTIVSVIAGPVIGKALNKLSQ